VVFSTTRRGSEFVYRCEGSNNIGQNGVDTVYVNVLCKSFYKDMQDISYCNCIAVVTSL
jgi:hypothetical protein